MMIFVDAVKEALVQVDGGLCISHYDKDKLIAANDPHGLRPFVIGRLGDAMCSLRDLRIRYDRCGVYPRCRTRGATRVRSWQGCAVSDLHKRSLARFVRWSIYILPVRIVILMRSISIQRVNGWGGSWRWKSFIDADIVTGVPDSSISAAIGYAEQTGIPYELGLIKNRYMGRTFIQPSQELREQGVKMKLSAVRKVVEGKRVVMIDDSIVRGTTSLRIVNLLREAGATEVHVRITSPPFHESMLLWDRYADRKELIAAQKSVEEIRQAINADSLYFLSQAGLLESIGRSDDRKRTAGCARPVSIIITRRNCMDIRSKIQVRL